MSIDFVTLFDVIVGDEKVVAPEYVFKLGKLGVVSGVNVIALTVKVAVAVLLEYIPSAAWVTVTTTDPVPFTVAVEPLILMTVLLGTLYENAPLLLLLTELFKLNGSLKRDRNKFVIPITFIVGGMVSACGADATLSRPLTLPSDTATTLIGLALNDTDTLVEDIPMMVTFVMTLLSVAFLICKS